MTHFLLPHVSIFKNIYMAALGLSCSIQDLHSGMLGSLFSLKSGLFLDFQFFFKNMYLCIWLHGVLVVACRIFSCNMRTQVRHVGSSSLTRDQTCAPCIGSSESQPLDQQGRPYLAFLKLGCPFPFHKHIM